MLDVHITLTVPDTAAAEGQLLHILACLRNGEQQGSHSDEHSEFRWDVSPSRVKKAPVGKKKEPSLTFHGLGGRIQWQQEANPAVVVVEPEPLIYQEMPAPVLNPYAGGGWVHVGEVPDDEPAAPENPGEQPLF